LTQRVLLEKKVSPKRRKKKLGEEEIGEKKIPPEIDQLKISSREPVYNESGSLSHLGRMGAEERKAPYCRGKNHREEGSYKKGLDSHPS